MAKIVIIGAGSGFGSRLAIDILSREALRDSTIGLCDINRTRLEQVHRHVQRVVDHHKLPATVLASTDRRALLPGADFVVTSISAAGGAYWGFPFTAEIETPDLIALAAHVLSHPAEGLAVEVARCADKTDHT